MFFAKKKGRRDDGAAADAAPGTPAQQHKPCCASKEEATRPSDKAAPSVFEFFSSGSDDAGLSMLGQCQRVEGGLNACVWVPTSERQHKIVF